MTDIPVISPPAPKVGKVVLYGEDTGSGIRLMSVFPNGDTTELASETGQPGEDSLLVLTADWHVGKQLNSRVVELVGHLNSLGADGAIDLGDCSEGFGLASAHQMDEYCDIVRDEMPWLSVNPGSGNASYPILPGNHDEVHDYASPIGEPTDFTIFNQRLWGPPYRWSADWAQARIRFLAIHSYIRHAQPYLGFFTVDQSDVDWLEDQLDAVPNGWKAIVCSHAPANPGFGNFIFDQIGGAALRQLLALKSNRIAAYLNGHRHGNMGTGVLDGIRHFNMVSTSYTQGNGLGAYATVRYSSSTNSLLFRCFYGVPPWAEFPTSLYTPVNINL